MEYTNLWLAAVMTIPVVTTGLIAWRWALEGERLNGILLMHLVLGCISTLLIWMVWFIHLRTKGTHLGGFLSGVNVVVSLLTN
jgi:hypothetical protein